MVLGRATGKESRGGPDSRHCPTVQTYYGRQLSLVQGNRSHSPLKSACFMHEPAVVTGFKFVDGTSWGVSRGEQGRGVSA